MFSTLLAIVAVVLLSIKVLKDKRAISSLLAKFLNLRYEVDDKSSRLAQLQSAVWVNLEACLKSDVLPKIGVSLAITDVYEGDRNSPTIIITYNNKWRLGTCVKTPDSIQFFAGPTMDKPIDLYKAGGLEDGRVSFPTLIYKRSLVLETIQAALKKEYADITSPSMTAVNN